MSVRSEARNIDRQLVRRELLVASASNCSLPATLVGRMFKRIVSGTSLAAGAAGSYSYWKVCAMLC